jgi:hypothetical protein
MLHFKTLTGLFLLALLSVQCTPDDAPPAPDVSHIPMDIKIQRFDRDIFAIDTTNVSAAMQPLAARYPDLMTLFCVNMIHDVSNPKETPDQALKGFLTAPSVRFLFDTVQQVYGDLSALETDLNQMFRYYKHYFPQKPTPEVATIVSEYVTDAFTAGDNLCGIGLDMFLGENFPGYSPEIFPGYIRRQFRREYIPVRLAKAVAQNAAEAPTGSRLLEQMLQNGKVLYIAQCLLPTTPDSLIMGYTQSQMDGCKANEQEVWARLLSENLLYSTDFNKFKKLVTPSPNAPVVFQEAPGEIGNWMGWQIVKAWMRRNHNATMDDLLRQQDAQAFLEAAKYKPRRQ